MKYILTFLFGAACGVGGTLLWLRKDIKERLEKAENSDELPFVIGDENTKENNENSSRSENTASQGHSTHDISKREQEKVDYHRIVSAVQNGEKPSVPIPVMPREHDGYMTEEESDEVEDDLDIQNLSEIPNEVFEIDKETFNHDESNEKSYLTYFQGDRIMATESGAIIAEPAVLIGPNWEQYVGHYAMNTAFIRNPRLATDYEIILEDGLYEEEYGPADI